MKKSPLAVAAAIITIAGLGLASPVEARRHHYRDPGHGHCLRFNKTTGAVAGAVGGGLLGNAVLGGTGGTLVGAAAGGVAGHELAHNRRKRCR
ncbi:glycine zipper 2TM domain-containing protein [Sphingobium mellinum]|uniref:glycine zipper 2TM domain-containing protein n=1 Tax=Sphingobium mellinum TaxID=1387166 RepID=UPI0030EF7234